MSLPILPSLAIHSSLADDSDLGELVARYVKEMPERIECVRRLVADADFDDLADLAHQLKGSAGSHGFPQLTPAAAAVERAIHDGDGEQEIRAAVDALVDLCRRVR